MRQIITFLGTVIKPTHYLLGETEYTGRVFAEALLQFVEFDRMLVCATRRVRETTWPVLASLEDPRIVCLDIDTGRDSEELWRIFDTLTSSVNEGDTIIFDITHGLRSLPFLVFLAAAFLKTARQVAIEAIYYGAYELGQPAPVIDLSEFVGLLDWLAAADRFAETGDGRPLASLLRAAGRFEHPQRQLTAEEQAWADASRRIVSAASAIEETSRALLTTLVPHAAHANHLLSIRLDEAEEDLAEQVPPYRLMAERIRTTYAPFALEKPMADELEADLDIQLKMVRWYLDNGHIPQAVTLAREWIVTAVGYRLGMRAPQILDFHKGRRPIGEALGWLAHYRPTASALLADEPPAYAHALHRLSGSEEIARLWDQLTSVRNFINHAAMKTSWAQTPSKTVVEQVRTLCDRLQELAPSLVESVQ